MLLLVVARVDGRGIRVKPMSAQKDILSFLLRCCSLERMSGAAASQHLMSNNELAGIE